MEYTEEYLELLKNQRKLVADIFNETIFEVSDNIREIIKARWLRGESINGGPIVNKQTGLGYASTTYQALKVLKNPSAGGNVDLTFTGQLGDNIDLVIHSSGDTEIYSKDSKYMTIGYKYGFEEFGLNDKEQKEIFEIIENKLTSKLEKLYG